MIEMIYLKIDFGGYCECKIFDTLKELRAYIDYLEKIIIEKTEEEKTSFNRGNKDERNNNQI